MARILRFLRDGRSSAIATRHAATASIWAAASVLAGTFLTLAGAALYEESSRRVIWALAEHLGPLAG